jgi:hypothetical protein
MKLFGFEIKREEEQLDIPSFTPRETDDGALVVSAGGTYGTYLDLEGSARTEAEIVAKYREMSIQPEVELAINDIVGEAIVKEGKKKVVEIDLDDLDYAENIKERIVQEWDKISELLNFNNYGYEIFKRWYVDGRIYYHLMIDINNPRAGIQELRYIDPRKIRKIRPVKRVRKGQVYVNVTDSEFYMYNERGFKGASATGMDNQGLQIAKDSILHVTSGVVDKDNKVVLGYLHKAIKPLNQLRILEDATVIYRISRAPERRIFSIDVGNLPKMKAEQYVRDIMVKHKNRLIYDATTGNVRDDRKFMTMLEDYWFPRRADGGGTQVTTLPSGQNLGELADVEYFEKKLYQSLNVPVSRMVSDSGFNLGRSSEITRDELKFQKFILRLRTKFSELFSKALEKQLILTGVISDAEWKDIQNKIHFDFQVDNYFAELKEGEILTNRINTLALIDPYVGKYYSEEWVQKNILQLTDEDIEQMQLEMQQDVQKNFELQKQQMELQSQLPQPPAPEGGEDGRAPAPGGQPTGPEEPQLSQ